MARCFAMITTGSRSVSYLLGVVVIGLLIAVQATSMDAAGVGDWALKVFGATFIAILGALVFTVLFCWTRYRDLGSAHPDGRVWLEGGLHAANAVSTVALTYTLLGISLGIGVLAGQALTPDTVQEVIQGLTDHFSMAFLTSVVGLPSAAALRALLCITEARLNASNERLGFVS